MSGIIGSKSIVGTGGSIISNLSGHTIHLFTSSGTFTPATTGFVDVLAIGAGGNSGAAPATPQAGGGGAGSTLYRKFFPVTAGTPYSIVMSGNTVFAGIITAYVGGNGGDATGAGNPGFSSPNASGGGGSSAISAPGGLGGTGAGVVGRGFPGNNAGGFASFGEGRGGAGCVHISGMFIGGPGVPISYFTGNSTDIASVGGSGGSGAASGITSTSYGSGGSVVTGSASPVSGRPGALYVKYF